MIRTPPEHNTKNPPGQIRYPVNKGLYLRDVIARIQGEEGVKLPTPIAGPEYRLNSLVAALERACGVVENDNWENPRHTPSLRTAVIRKIIKENT